MGTNIERTIQFLKEQFDQSPYFSAHPREKKYRFEHSLRVANIGRRIALAEGLDEEALVIGCLLHDLSYIEPMESREEQRNHGRAAAKLARPFLETLDLTPEQIAEICFGIAIHVDDQADFPGERTPLALSISDADNIDRFDVYRLHENLTYSNFLEMSYEEQVDHVTQTQTRLEKYKQMEFGTKTATKLWRERLEFQLEFMARLKAQLDSSITLL